MKKLNNYIQYPLLIILLTSVLSSAQVFAQKDENQVYREALLKEKYEQAEDIEWNIDAHGNYEAEFKLNGNKYRADFGTNGRWIETERSIDWDKLPEVIQDEVRKEYDKDDIAEIEWVEHFTKGIFYDVEIKAKGKNMDLEFNSTGKRLN